MKEITTTMQIAQVEIKKEYFKESMKEYFNIFIYDLEDIYSFEEVLSDFKEMYVSILLKDEQNYFNKSFINSFKNHHKAYLSSI